MEPPEIKLLLLNVILMNLPKREELLFLFVLALPRASIHQMHFLFIQYCSIGIAPLLLELNRLGFRHSNLKSFRRYPCKFCLGCHLCDRVDTEYVEFALIITQHIFM